MLKGEVGRAEAGPGSAQGGCGSLCVEHGPAAPQASYAVSVSSQRPGRPYSLFQEPFSPDFLPRSYTCPVLQPLPRSRASGQVLNLEPYAQRPSLTYCQAELPILRIQRWVEPGLPFTWTGPGVLLGEQLVV